MRATAKRIPLILCLCLMSGVSFAKGQHQLQPVAKHKQGKAATRSHAGENPGSHAALVIDTAGNTVLHAHNAGEPWYPASLTKMMTAFMAFDAMESGRLSPDEMLTVSYHAAEQKGSRLGLRSGERITVDDAIRGLIARSANDAAVTLAEHIGGNEGDFAAAMTAKAHQIGMSHSSFENATGLPAPQQITTAHDMALLAQTLIRRFPSQYHYFQTDSMTFHHRTMGAINPLLRSYQGAEGMKTGFTCASGYNIVGAAKRDGRRLIAVYLGGGSRNHRNTEVARLLDAGFADNRNAAQLPALDDASVVQASNQYPIHRLGPNVCNSTVPPVNTAAHEAPRSQPAVARASRNRPTLTADAKPHRSWGVVVGNFPNRRQSQGVLKQLRSNAPAVVAHSQATIITRTLGKGSQQYATLLTGLERGEAGRLCSIRNWERGVSCTALDPIALRAIQ